VSQGRSDLVTVCSIAVVAYAACDLIHEVAGHGLACLLSSEVGALSLSTVALQTSRSSRMVAASGTIANLVAGLLAWAACRRGGQFRPSLYFLWLLGAINLMNAFGYLVFSAVLDSGDWGVVIAGWEPHWAWRTGMGFAGLVLYLAAVRMAAAELTRMSPDSEDVSRLILSSYLAGGLLLVAGAALNPISPSLILLSGVSTGFGAMAGLLAVGPLVERAARTQLQGPRGQLERSRGWIAAGLAVALLFVAWLGPGINFIH